MKNIILAFALLTVRMTISAQNYIDDLDNESLVGTWEVTSMSGTFRNFQYEDKEKTVSTIKFEDGQYTMMTFTDGSQTMFRGYWVSCVRTDRYYLHMYPWNSSSIVNFRVLQFHEGVLTLVSYDRMGTMYLKKQETNDVASVRAEAKTDTTTYNMAGVPVPKSTKGIIIQDGKKLLIP